MKRTYTNALAAPVAALSLLWGACGASGEDDVDTENVERFRAAIPSVDALAAPDPTINATRSLSANAVGDTAIYPVSALPIVEGVNGSIATMISLLETITALPPTVFNSETNEYVWGPYPNDDGVGFVAAYIRDTEGSGDFRYEYAFLRGIDNDLAKLAPVIYGGATPGPNDEDGVGVTLWDFEADRAFSEAHDPDFDPTAGNRGRFAALYGAEASEDGFVVVAVLRDFVGEDEPDAEPADLDYFYGHFMGDGETFDFLDFEFALDIDAPTDGIAEDVGVRLAVANGAVGRAEADAVGGSMEASERVEITECWDAAVEQTFLELTTLDGGDVTGTISDGNETDCGAFSSTLAELGVPSLEDVPAELIGALDEIATNGIPAE